MSELPNNNVSSVKPEPGKGDYGGECNRTACDFAPATCFNTSTRRYYCIPCARRINNENGEILCEIRGLRDEQ